MMGHREQMVGGAEFDAFTRWRRFLHWKPGMRRWIKRHFWKRIRQHTRQQLRGLR